MAFLPSTSNIKASYSFKRKVASYTGPCVKVRRSSDDTLLDIGFFGDSFDEYTYLNFIGTGSGFVHTWYDQADNYDLTQTTNANQPQLVQADYNYMLKCTGGDFVSNTSFMGAKTNSTISLIWQAPITKPSGFTTYQSGAIIDTADSKYLAPYFTTNQGPMFYQTDSTFLYQHGHTILHTFTFENGTCRIYEYGAQSRIESSTPNPDWGQLVLGKTNFSSGDLYIGECTVWDAVVSATSLYTVFSSDYNNLLPTNGDNVYLSIGDSISTTTYSGGPGTNWCYLAHKNASSSWHFGAVQSGTTLSDWNTDVSKCTWYAQNLTNKKMIAIVFLGGNDILGGATGAQAFTRLETFVTALKSGGFDEVKVITCLPRYATGTQNNTDFETHRQTFNDAIVANANGLFDDVIDVETIAIGTNGNQDTTTNYSVDHIHLNSTGHVLLAGLVDNYIDNTITGGDMGTVDEGLGGRDIQGNVTSGSSSAFLDYSAGTDYTYTSTAVEFTNGAAALKNQYSSNITCAAAWSTVKTLDYSRDGGVKTVVAESGTITFSGGKMCLTSGANARVIWEGVNNLPKGGVGSIKFLWTPNYTGAPASLQYGPQWNELSGATRNYMYFIDNAATMYSQVNNGAAATKHAGSYAYSPVSGTEYEILLTFDMPNNLYNLYFDGTRRSTANSSAYTPDYTDKLIGRFFLGDNNADAGSVVANFKIRNLIVYDTVVESGASYTPGYTMPASKYLTSDSTIQLTTGITISTLTGFDAVTYASGSDAVKFHFDVGGTKKYWNGSAWATSDGTYAQSNTVAEVETNKASFPAGVVKPIAVLHSADGSTTPSISSVLLNYT